MRREEDVSVRLQHFADVGVPGDHDRALGVAAERPAEEPPLPPVPP